MDIIIKCCICGAKISSDCDLKESKLLDGDGFNIQECKECGNNHFILT